MIRMLNNFSWEEKYVAQNIMEEHISEVLSANK